MLCSFRWYFCQNAKSESTILIISIYVAAQLSAIVQTISSYASPSCQSIQLLDIMLTIYPAAQYCPVYLSISTLLSHLLNIIRTTCIYPAANCHHVYLSKRTLLFSLLFQLDIIVLSIFLILSDYLFRCTKISFLSMILS